jgi:hypothetical protein
MGGGRSNFTKFKDENVDKHNGCLKLVPSSTIIIMTMNEKRALTPLKF